jgi:hypothetical protein
MNTGFPLPRSFVKVQTTIMDYRYVGCSPSTTTVQRNGWWLVSHNERLATYVGFSVQSKVTNFYLVA